MVVPFAQTPAGRALAVTIYTLSSHNVPSLLHSFVEAILAVFKELDAFPWSDAVQLYDNAEGTTNKAHKTKKTKCATHSLTSFLFTLPANSHIVHLYSALNCYVSVLAGLIREGTYSGSIPILSLGELTTEAGVKACASLGNMQRSLIALIATIELREEKKRAASTPTTAMDVEAPLQTTTTTAPQMEEAALSPMDISEAPSAPKEKPEKDDKGKSSIHMLPFSQKSLSSISSFSFFSCSQVQRTGHELVFWCPLPDERYTPLSAFFPFDCDSTPLVVCLLLQG
jgi:hypothetical protein